MAINPLTGLEDEAESESIVRRRWILQQPQGLRALAAAEPREEFPLVQEPLRGGELSRPPELEKPAPLSTEAVPRTPSMQEPMPLLGPQARLGAAFGEAERGEESLPTPGGQPPRMTGQQRTEALMSFFRPQEPSGTQEALGTARQAVGGARQALGLGKAFLEGTRGIASFAPLTSLTTPATLAGTSASTGFAPYTQEYAASQLGPGLSGAARAIPWLGSILGLGGGALGLAKGDLPSGAAGVATGGAGLASLLGMAPTAAAPAVGALSGGGLGAYNLSQGRIGAGVGGPGGGMLGGMFHKPEIPLKGRKTLETARHGQQVTTFLQSLSRVDSPQALYDRLARAASGTQQSIIVGAKLPPNDPGLVWSEKARTRHGAQPSVAAIVGPTTGNFEQPRLTPDRLMELIRTNPEQLFVKVQAGVSPEKLAPLNKAVRNVIVSLAGRLAPSEGG